MAKERFSTQPGPFTGSLFDCLFSFQPWIEPPLQAGPIEDLTSFYHSIISIPVSGGKFILLSGLISGQQIENLLSFYAWPAAEIDDFSRLPNEWKFHPKKISQHFIGLFQFKI